MKKLALALVAALLIAGLVAATCPWRVPRALVAQALEAGLPRSGGLHASLAGPATFKLLPRPRIQATQVAVTDDRGAVMLDVPLLKAELDIPSLAHGLWRLTSATLVGPTATLDLDRIVAPILTEQGDHPPLQIRLRSGVLRLRSSSGPGDLLATGLDATLTSPGDSDALVLSGVATVKGTTARFAGTLQHPSLGLTPKGSTATVQVNSPCSVSPPMASCRVGSSSRAARRSSPPLCRSSCAISTAFRWPLRRSAPRSAAIWSQNCTTCPSPMHRSGSTMPASRVLWRGAATPAAA